MGTVGYGTVPFCTSAHTYVLPTIFTIMSLTLPYYNVVNDTLPVLWIYGILRTNVFPSHFVKIDLIFSIFLGSIYSAIFLLHEMTDRRLWVIFSILLSLRSTFLSCEKNGKCVKG